MGQVCCSIDPTPPDKNMEKRALLKSNNQPQSKETRKKSTPKNRPQKQSRTQPATETVPTPKTPSGQLPEDDSDTEEIDPNLFDIEPEQETISPAIIAEWKKAAADGNIAGLAQLHETWLEQVLECQWPGGERALHKAIRRNDNKMIYFLLDCGADADAKNNAGQTPLHMAVQEKNKNVISLLLTFSADPTISDNRGSSPLQLAVASGLDESIINDLDVNGEYARRRASSWEQTVFGDQTRSNTMPEHASSIVNTTKSEKATAVDVFTTMIQAEDEKSGAPLDVAERERRDTRTRTLSSIHDAADQLKDLSGWLEKRRPKLKSYQRRWVIVRGSYMLWSERKMDIVNTSSASERQKFNQAIALTTIRSVTNVDTSAQNKFMVRVQRKKKADMRDYTFKTGSRAERDFWVENLLAHKRYHESMMNFLDS